MELVHTQQVSFNELLNETIDILIVACGVETRSSYLTSNMRFDAPKKIALLFDDSVQSETLQKNKDIFVEKGFECYTLTCNAADQLMALLETVTEFTHKENIKLVVDYSSMSKIWYGTIINYFAFNDLEYNSLVVYFCYTPEHFFPNAAKKGNLLKPEPLSFKKPAVNDEKPLVLVIGLGYDESKVSFLCDFFKPSDVYFFLPNPSFNDSYTQMAQNNNRQLLSEVKSNRLFQYPAKNLEEIDSRLTSICMSLRLKHRIIMISLGPKTFSLASFLLNTRYPDIEIWNMCTSDQNFDLKPADVPIVYKAILSGDDA